MNNSLFVQVGDTAANGPDEIGSITFIVAALVADPVKQFASLRQLRHQVHCMEEIEWYTVRSIGSC